MLREKYILWMSVLLYEKLIIQVPPWCSPITPVADIFTLSQQGIFT